MRSRGTAARLRATLTTVAVVAALAACTGEDPEPGPTASGGPVSVSPSPVPTPSERPAPETVAPERPEAMDDDGVAGAEATARYFFELYTYAFTTGHTDQWRALSHDACEFCLSVEEGVADLYGSGGRGEGSSVEWLRLEAEHLTGGRFGVTGRVREAPSVELGPEGEIVDERTHWQEYDVVLALESDPWRVLEVDVSEPDGGST